MTVSAARENLPDAVETARTEAVFLERYGPNVPWEQVKADPGWT